VLPPPFYAYLSAARNKFLAVRAPTEFPFSPRIPYSIRAFLAHFPPAPLGDIKTLAALTHAHRPSLALTHLRLLDRTCSDPELASRTCVPDISRKQSILDDFLTHPQNEIQGDEFEVSCN
jgi:hypothetical protein